MPAISLPHRHAFSLIELSIVLVILGLLTGGILAGQSLIRAAELRSFSTDIQRFNTAYYGFRERFLALPGDIPAATRFWGAADGGDGMGEDCFTIDTMTLTDTRATCNGSGDGRIRTPTGANGSMIWYYGERLHVWKHMANAGLIEGSYTGVTMGPTFFDTAPGVNLPAGKMGGAFYDIYATTVTESPYGDGRDYNSIRMGLQSGARPFSPAEAWAIDIKMDDGHPNTGILVIRTSDVNCVTSTSTPATAYALSYTDRACFPHFVFR